jgi:hypothetical protein
MVIILPNRNCLVYHWLYRGSYINMKKYEVKIPMCLVGIVEAKDKDEAIEIASESFSTDNTPCEWWDIVEPNVIEVE